MVKEMKKTSLGLLPNDWDVDILEHHLKIQTGSRNTEDKQENGKYPFFVRSSKIEHIDTYHYDCEAILTAGDGVGTGKVFHYINGKFDAHQRVYILTEFDGIKGKYFYYYFRENFLKEVSKYTAKSSVDSVRKDMIAKMAVPIPKIEEQVAIAEALSDVDSLISSLQKLIEKKKAIKQGAMQELLTGKKRLSGFSGEWKKERLGDISDIKDGTHGTFQRVDRGYPLLSAKNVYNNHLDIAENESLISSEDYYSIIANGFPRKGDILLSCVGTIGRCCIYSGMPKVAFQRSVAFIRVKECVASYILQYMQSENANKQLLNSANASAQAGVYLGAISDIEVYMPCCVKEQQAIAQVLSDMDSEIEQQEKKLAKYQQIK